MSFDVGATPPKDSILLCKICKFPPHYVNFYNTRVYYIFSDTTSMTRAYIHLGNHLHPIAFGTCGESLNSITELIIVDVSKTPTATNYAIALAA